MESNPNQRFKILNIKTKRLLLREIIASDLENIYKGLSHKKIIKHYGISYTSIEKTKEQMAWFSKPTQCWWAICSLDNKTFYGACGLNDICEHHKKAEIGLWLLPEFWRQGIMKEVMPIICNFGFNELGLHRIEGFVEADNLACKKGMSKTDFTYEGCMKDCEIKNGKYISIDIYSKLNPTPKKIKNLGL